MKLAKVVNIFSKQEITEMPYSMESASDIMLYLMQYGNPRTGDPVTQKEMTILDNLLSMVENNSGILREEVLERLDKGA